MSAARHPQQVQESLKKALYAAGIVAMFGATPGVAQWREYAGGQQIIGDGNPNTTYYFPSITEGEPGCNLPDRNGVNIPGECVFIYVLGDHNLSDCAPPGVPCYTDQVLMFWNPNTWAGHTSRFAGGTRLLPGIDYLGQTMPSGPPDYAGYSAPSVLKFGGEYFMTATQDAAGAGFRKQWWGVSPDGKSWTWYPLFENIGAPPSILLISVSLQPVRIAGQDYFFGIVEVGNGPIGLGLIRLRVNPQRARRYDRVEIYRDGVWVTVVSDPLTNPGGQFDFDSSPPTILRSGRSPKLLPNHEVWYSNFSDLRDCSAQCNNNFAPPSSNGKSTYGDRLHVAHLAIPATSTGVATFVDAGILHSSVRCMPSNYDAGRYTAVATTGGTPRLLYSSSNDLGYGNGGYCQSDFAGYQNYRGMYIVATAFLSDGYHTVTPCRVFDSRSGSPLASGVERTINVGGACSVPASAKAIAFNVTVVSPSGSGDLSI